LQTYRDFITAFSTPINPISKQALQRHFPLFDKIRVHGDKQSNNCYKEEIKENCVDNGEAYDCEVQVGYEVDGRFDCLGARDTYFY